MILNGIELIKNGEVNNKFEIYPNPNTGSFTIDLGEKDIKESLN